MKKILAAIAVATVPVLGLPTTALVFNPQPDPPGFVLVNPSISAVNTVGILVQVIPPGPCRIVVPLLPPGPCTPPATG